MGFITKGLSPISVISIYERRNRYTYKIFFLYNVISMDDTKSWFVSQYTIKYAKRTKVISLNLPGLKLGRFSVAYSFHVFLHDLYYISLQFTPE